MRWFVVLACVGCRFDFDSIDGSYRAAVLADQPIGYWRLGDLTTVAKDETGHADGHYVGACQRGVAGALANDADTATLFAGNSCYVELADAYNFVGNAPFAVELWTKPTTLSSYQHFFTRQTRTELSDQPMDGYALLFDSALDGVKLERTVATVNSASPASTIAVGAFLHIVANYDGVTSQVFVDGVAGASKVDPCALEAVSFVALIGVGSLANNYAYVDGVVDEVAIYDHALPGNRIAVHHDIGVNGP